MKITNKQKDDLTKAIKWGMLRSLRGQRVCMTGTLSVDRKSLMLLVTLLGGENHSSVTSTTTVLVVPNENVREGSKYKTAKTRGIEIISEEQFCDVILRTPEELLSYNS